MEAPEAHVNFFTWSNATEKGRTGTAWLHNQPWLLKYKSSLKCKLKIDPVADAPLIAEKSC